MGSLGFGIVGTGMIAGVIARAIGQANNAQLVAVSGRRIETASAFVAGRPGVTAIEGFEDLIARPDIDAVYIATPTQPKQSIALAAIAAGKHVLVEKPFLSRESVQRMTDAAASREVAFMDATHFVHHPRTAAIRQAGPALVGAPRSLHTTFYFPFSDRANIRFDARLEPMSALGDLGWYSMRAAVEYLRPAGNIAKVTTAAERDASTGAVVRAAGVIAFDGGEVSTFDVGYTAGTVLMDLQLLGTTGVIGMDDFVLDWTDSWAFKNPDIPAGYTLRAGLATRRDIVFHPAPAKVAAEVAMIENFAAMAATRNRAAIAAHSTATLRTQEYLDAIWAAANA